MEHHQQKLLEQFILLLSTLNNMKHFNPQNLQPGDILLFRTMKNSPFHDKLIAFGEWLVGEKMTKHSYHHVAMVGVDTQIFEAIWKGTMYHPYAEVDKTGDIEVYRVKNATDIQIQEALEWASDNLGLKYDFVKLFLGWAGLDQKHAEICSTFVGKAWLAAGVQVAPKTKEKIYSPDDIAANKKVLKRVGIIYAMSKVRS